MDASGINDVQEITERDFNGAESANAPLPEIPYYDEDLDEPFTGPSNLEEWDETYDDNYEAEATRLLEGPAVSQDLESSGRGVSANTQSAPP